MMVNDLVKSDLALKSDNFYDDVDRLLVDIEKPIDDLKNLLRHERISEKEKVMIKGWIERLEDLADEMDDWDVNILS